MYSRSQSTCLNKRWVRHTFAALAAILWCAVTFYLTVPAINLRAFGFWSWLFWTALCYGGVYFLLLVKSDAFDLATFFDKNKKGSGRFFDRTVLKRAWIFKILAVVAVVILILILVLLLASSRLAAADRYHQMLTVTESDFVTDIAELPMSQIPVVDYDTAQRLGSRKIGEVVTLVSQFNVSDYYTQINYRNAPTRVSPLEYDGIIKWFNNKSAGIPYYVSINMATQDTELVQLPEGMKYAPCEYFSRDLMRHIRFQYPTKMFEEVSFEIDESGHPYWIVPYYTYTINIFGGRDIAGIILTDAVTGASQDLPVDQIPQWIDRVYSEDLLVEQIDNWGSLSNGYWNTVFGQKNVVISTDGHGYLAIEDDIWLYTGLTSVVMDESNIGFILVNLRTKEARTYTVNGAEEYSAMASAEGKVQEKGYTATFPILINIEGIPSYFLSLKDNAGLIKAYAFVSVSDYQIVGVGDTLASAQSEYLRLLDLPTDPNPPQGATTEVSGSIQAIADAVLNGNTTYYIQIDGKIYLASVTLDTRLPFLAVGDTVKLSVDASQNVVALLEVTD